MPQTSTTAQTRNANEGQAGASPVGSQTFVVEGTHMTHTRVDNHRPLGHRHITDYPQLAKLGLSNADLEEASHQGFVCEERRRGRSYFKLRFRCAGRQIVRYIGRNTERVAAVRAELTRLQANVRWRHELAALVKNARQMLRAAKSALEPLLQSRGFVFHGLAIRKPRKHPHK